MKAQLWKHGNELTTHSEQNDVGDPMLNAPEGIEILGKPSMFIFENVGDQDFASLYPSIIRAYNLDPMSQVGKFFLIDTHIKEKLSSDYDYEGLFSVSKNEAGSETDTDQKDVGVGTNDVGPTLIDSLESQNWNRIGEKFFDLPSATDLIRKIREKKGN